jgi:phosphohistidine phosphatase
MLIFLVRHAHAEKGEPDELRPLSDRGREEAKALAAQLAGHATPPALVLTSPLLRARQAAEPIAREAGVELRVDERLSPGMTAERLREALEELDDAESPVAVVGHQPDLSEIAFELTGEDPGFPTGGVAEIVVEAGRGQTSA